MAREDRLAYDEPRDWFFPVRHMLGAQLLTANRAPEAEAVYHEDLLRNPANGWGSIEIRPVARTYAADRGWYNP